MTIEIMDLPSNEFVNSWECLYHQQAVTHPLIDWRIVGTATRFFGDAQPKYVTVEKGGEICLAAVVVDTGFGRASTYAPSQLPYCLVLGSPMVSAVTLMELFSEMWSRKWLYELLHVDERYQGFDFGGLPAIRVPYGQTMSIDVDDWDFDRYWERRDNKLRSNIRRYQRRCHSDFDISFRHTKDCCQIGERVDAYGLLETLGWKGQQGTAIHPENKQGQFYRQVLQCFSGSREAHIFELFFDEDLVASRLAVSSGPRIVFLKTTYAEVYKKYAPGRLLLYEVLKYCIQKREANQFEFYTKATRDQLQWATSSRWTYHVNLFKNGFFKNAWSIARKIRNIH